MFYEFYEDSCGCHTYIVKAKDIPDAVKKFISWQNKNLKKDERWPEKLIKDKSNWFESDITFVGFSE